MKWVRALAVLIASAGAVGVGASGAGCERAFRYPDLSTPDRAFRTFDEAWKQGDVTTLERVYTGLLLENLRAQIAKNGREAVAEYYRRGADRGRFEKLTVVDTGQSVAYLKARLEPEYAPAMDMHFSLARIGEDWKISNYVAERPTEKMTEQERARCRAGWRSSWEASRTSRRSSRR